MNINKSSKSLIFLIILVEFFGFLWGAKNYIAPFFPFGFDQIQYLTESYTAFEYQKLHGFIAALWFAVTNKVAQGALHDAFALLLMQINGPNRLSALLVNFIVFAVWQLSIYFVVKKITKSMGISIVAALLVLNLHSQWTLGCCGGIFDFRLDYLAAGLTGITLSISVLSNGFLNRLFSILFGLFIGITIATRFLTSTYFVIVFILLALIYLRKSQALDRFKNAILSGVIALLISVPILISNYDQIYGYYIVGHFLGPEVEIRKSSLDIFSRLLFIIDNGFLVMPGIFFYIPIIFIVLVRFGSLIKGRLPQKPDLVDKVQISLLLENGLVFILGPIIVLSLHGILSGTVLNILFPGIVAITCALMIPVLLEVHNRWGKLFKNGILGFLLISLIVFVGRVDKNPHTKEQLIDLAKLNQIADQIYEAHKVTGRPAIRVGVDRVVEFLDPQVMRVLIYERKHEWTPIEVTLPLGLFKGEEKLIFKRIKESDLFFLTERPNSISGFPFDIQMQEMYPALRKYCDENKKLLGQVDIFNRKIFIYTNP